MKVSVIIPAAGLGTRMGGPVPKQFLSLKGKPILHHTIEAFETCRAVDSITLVVARKDLPEVEKETVKKYPIIQRAVAGGEKRQDSVYNGFLALDADTGTVLVHDGVRPFVTSDLIRKTVEGARRFGAAITAIPINDTIKQVNSRGFVDRTVNREGLWRVQTPQAFQYSLLRDAFDKAIRDSFYGTDEGSLIEYLGKEVKIIPGSELNVKITRREDLIVGESILDCGAGNTR
ncbi:MAG: 2-C-methyl-D-erythritol 4-phosphate cytidylyltransferase [Nitrospinaceae bacterium]